MLATFDVVVVVKVVIVVEDFLAVRDGDEDSIVSLIKVLKQEKKKSRLIILDVMWNQLIYS